MLSCNSNCYHDDDPLHNPDIRPHIFASLCAFVKLEKIKAKMQRNHFELHARLYLRAIQSAFDELRLLRP